MKKNKTQKKAVSNIMAVVLLMAIAIVAVLVVYNFMIPFLKQKTSRMSTDTLTSNLELKKVLYDSATKYAEVQVYRPAGIGDISGIKFIFSDDAGNSWAYTQTNDLPAELETRTYSIYLGNNIMNPTKVDVAFVFGAGKETILSGIKDTGSVGFGTVPASSGSCYLELSINEIRTERAWCNGADMNQDDMVDMADYQLWYDNQARSGCNSTNSWCDGADTDKSGLVDMIDYQAWYDNNARRDCSPNEILDFKLFGVRTVDESHKLLSEYNPSNPQEYVLREYLRSGDVLAEYSFESRRLAFIDASDGSSKAFELDSALLNAVILFDNIAPVTAIKIVHDGKETDLNVDFNGISCARTCRAEGEAVDLFAEETCCSQLSPAQQDDGSFVCAQQQI